MTAGLAVTLSTVLFLAMALGGELFWSGRATGVLQGPPRASVQAPALLRACGFSVALVPFLFIASVPVLVLRLVRSAPRAVRLDAQALWVERLAEPPVRIPWSDLTRVEPGPPLGLFGPLRHHPRGHGWPWVLAIHGTQNLKGVGPVECWATRLGTPTVLVHRSTGLPLLLGVDDGEALLGALVQRVAPCTPAPPPLA